MVHDRISVFRLIFHYPGMIAANRFGIIGLSVFVAAFFFGFVFSLAFDWHPAVKTVAIAVSLILLFNSVIGLTYIAAPEEDDID